MFATLLSAFHFAAFAGSITVQSYICQPPITPTIIEPANGASVVATIPFIVDGHSTPSTAVVISDNGKDVAMATADQSSHYTVYVTASSAGDHILMVHASNPCGSATSAPLTVSASTPPPLTTPPTPPLSPLDNASTASSNSNDTISPPDVITTSNDQHTSHGLALSVRGPQTSSSTTDASVYVTGSTDVVATETIAVNGVTVASSTIPQTTFGFRVPLSLGANSIIIHAKSQTNTASVALTVIRVTTTTPIPWSKTTQGQTVIGALAVTGVSLIFIIFVIGIFLL